MGEGEEDILYPRLTAIFREPTAPPPSCLRETGANPPHHPSCGKGKGKKVIGEGGTKTPQMAKNKYVVLFT